MMWQPRMELGEMAILKACSAEWSLANLGAPSDQAVVVPVRPS